MSDFLSLSRDLLNRFGSMSLDELSLLLGLVVDLDLLDFNLFDLNFVVEGLHLLSQIKLLLNEISVLLVGKHQLGILLLFNNVLEKHIVSSGFGKRATEVLWNDNIRDQASFEVNTKLVESSVKLRDDLVSHL